VKKMKTKQDELVFVEGPGQKGGQKTTP